MAFCTNCGAQVAEGMAFCTNCGAQMAAARRGQTVRQAPQQAQRMQGTAQGRPSRGTRAAGAVGTARNRAARKKGSKKGLIIGLCAALVAVIAVVVVVIVLFSGGGETRWMMTRFVGYSDMMMRDVTNSVEREYDDRGNLVRAISYNAVGQQTGRAEWQYNEQGVPESAATYDGNNQQTVRAEMTWDEGKRQLNMKCYDMQGNLYYEERRTYNEAGGVLEQEILRNESVTSGSYVPRTVYQLNSDGRPEASTAYDENGNILRRTQDTLDRYGNVVHSETTYEDGPRRGEVSVTDMEYTYDNNGNYVLRTFEGGNPTSFEWKEVPKSFFWWYISIPAPR